MNIYRFLQLAEQQGVIGPGRVERGEMHDALEQLGIAFLRECRERVADLRASLEQYKECYDEAMVASNVAGFSGMSAAQTIEALQARVAELEKLSVTNILLDVVPGDGSGHEVYAESTDDVVNMLTKLDDANEALQARVNDLEVKVEQQRHLLHGNGVNINVNSPGCKPPPPPSPPTNPPPERDYALNSNATVAVSNEVYLEPCDRNTPRGAKVQLLTIGGVLVYGHYTGDSFYTHWAPCPRRRKE